MVSAVQTFCGLARSTATAACLAALTVLAPSASWSHEYKVGPLVVDQPWSRATAAKVGAGYVTIRNQGEAADRLVSASAEVATSVEIHAMSMKDGVMTMRALPQGLEIPAGQDVALKPGGHHLMLLGLKQPLKRGETFPGTLTFEKAGTVAVEFLVEGPGAAASGHDHKSH
ncbi:copper chaperone PCu(A)C [Rhodoligotrophos defluvii]|uniref:copper chaperone PCu(A)C n=1 Tax=Rhodoligotrophos defluvii TaxID=2561934 RepID=UPI0010C9E81A|nr:copper chaperone PCu(A)C [Rhodoligotrophos defluvii]